MVSEVPPALKDTLKRLRLTHGFPTQADLARAANVSEGTIGNVEAGTRNMSVATLEQVALALGLSSDEHAELLAAAGKQRRPSDVINRMDDFDRRLARIEALLEGTQRRRRPRADP